MSIDPAIFRVLVEQGASPEMLLAVVEAAAAVDEARKDAQRAGNRARQARFRSKTNTNNVSNALQNVTECDADAPPPNDIYSNPPEPSEAKASEPPFEEKVVSAWNDGPAQRGARKANRIDGARRRSLKLRTREHGQDAVFAAIRGIAASDWHCGIGSNGWRADLGWLLKSPENFLKALERAGDQPELRPPMDADARAAHLERLRTAPWMRGRENELPIPRRAA